MKISEVFVAGGLPTITYNPRADLNLEKRLLENLDDGFKLISITGPTKSGKSVLVNKLINLKDRVSVSGGSINFESDLWEQVLGDIGMDIEDGATITHSNENTKTGELEAGLEAFVFKAGGKVGDSNSTGREISKSTMRIRNLRATALQGMTDLGVYLVIDDFHYIPGDVQKVIVRALKQPIFEGLRVILIAVPHRAYDSLKVENEMTGRVIQMGIPLWTIEELTEIALSGFEKLNISCDHDIINNLATESFGSPHLMQEFCKRLCKNNGIEDDSKENQIIAPPIYEDFYKQIVTDISSKIQFESLARGPRQRADRMQRQLHNGETVDIYKATLHAIANTGPKTQIEFEELRTSIRLVMADTPPKGHEVKRVLSEMDKISKNMQGEPVLDWDRENTLYISDPFFAFYLKWDKRIDITH